MMPAHERGAARTLCCDLFGEQIGPAFQPGPDRAAPIRFPITPIACQPVRDLFVLVSRFVPLRSSAL